MGNSIFSKGTQPAPGLTAGTYEGVISTIEPGTAKETGELFYIFKGHIDLDGTRHHVSAVASPDTIKTRKLVRWMLALAGKTPEQVPDNIDLSQLPTAGRAQLVVSYERTKRNEETGKFDRVRTEFPQLADVLPLPRDGQAQRPAAPAATDDVPF